MTNFKHGDSVLCTIEGVDITDAKISINNNGEIYICQNICYGEDIDNKLGYKYSYYYEENVTNLRLATREYEVGDVLISSKTKNVRKILSIIKYYELSSEKDIDKSCDFMCSMDDLENNGYSLYTPELIEVDGKKYSKEEILKLTPIL